jgi:hypothetical protein
VPRPLGTPTRSSSTAGTPVEFLILLEVKPGVGYR